MQKKSKSIKLWCAIVLYQKANLCQPYLTISFFQLNGLNSKQTAPKQMSTDNKNPLLTAELNGNSDKSKTGVELKQ